MGGGKTPLVSVIVNAYNEEDVIGDCLKSVLNASLKGMEVIVVNDGSTDETKKIAQDFGVKVIDSSHEGLPQTRNIGAAAAKGRIICFVDADMKVGKDYFKKIVHDIKNFDFVDHTEKSKTSNWVSDYIAYVRAHKRKPVHGRAYKKGVLEKFDPKYGYYCESEMAERLVKKGRRFGLSSAVAYHKESTNPKVFITMGKSMVNYFRPVNLLYTISSLTPFFALPAAARSIKYGDWRVFFWEWYAKILMSYGLMQGVLKSIKK